MDCFGIRNALMKCISLEVQILYTQINGVCCVLLGNNYLRGNFVCKNTVRPLNLLVKEPEILRRSSGLFNIGVNDNFTKDPYM